jgi:hypothetical protein
MLMNTKQIQRLDEINKKSNSDILAVTDKEWELVHQYQDEKLSQELKENCKHVYCIVRSVNKMGDSRVIDMLYINKFGRLQTIIYQTNKVFSTKRDGKKQGYKIGGGGMDMCFALVSGLSEHLHADYSILSKEEL